MNKVLLFTHLYLQAIFNSQVSISIPNNSVTYKLRY